MFDDILRLLNTSSLLRSPQVVELIPYSQDAFRAKVRAEVTDELTLQVWLNHNERGTRYAYQLFRHGKPILRWDNAPHHPEHGANFPHHFHDEFGQLTTSQLSGHPLADLPMVLVEVENYLQGTSKT